MQNIDSACNYVNQSFTNVSATVVGAAGKPWCISGLPNTGVLAWSVVPAGNIVSVTANMMGSIDGLNWFQMDQITQGDTAGAANGIYFTGWSTTGEQRWVTNRPVNYIRIDAVTVNGGGSVTGSFALFEPNR